MTIQEAYLILWSKVPDASRIDVDIETEWMRQRAKPVATYTVSLWDADGEFHQTESADLAGAVSTILAQAVGAQPADLDLIQQQITSLQI